LFPIIEGFFGNQRYTHNMCDCVCPSYPFRPLRHPGITCYFFQCLPLALDCFFLRFLLGHNDRWLCDVASDPQDITAMLAAFHRGQDGISADIQLAAGLDSGPPFLVVIVPTGGADPFSGFDGHGAAPKGVE